MDNPLLWAMLLFLLAIAALLAELMVPSAGLLTLISAAATVAALVIIWRYDSTTGIIATVVVMLLIPVAVGTMLYLAPRTFVGRKMRLKSEPPAPTVAQSPVKVGQTGQALTDLRPVGTCLIDGHRVECISDTGLIPRGRTVRVTSVQGMEVYVREKEG